MDELKDLKEVNEAIFELVEALRMHKKGLDRHEDAINRIDAVLAKFHELHGIMLDKINRDD